MWHWEHISACPFTTETSLGARWVPADRGAPTTFAPNQVIKGWTEAMQLMVEGDKWEMYIPSDMAYGDHGRVPGCLVFTMEIVKINGGSKPKVKKEVESCEIAA